ncbi:hypothetical protein HHI36_019311 [Cryptolaemus montrouzieri]|uniref:Nucleoside diphosphate kinase-like domain-containing protein n=1 Tax=Cryptolaemus montrouzieri TaxID=559131 RepID=A0ABD2P2S9_9CUCU
MEWAGLQHEFTEPAQTLATDISEDQSMISWTSQPPAQMILGTVGPYKIRHSLISNEDISLELGKIKERSRSFLRLGPKGVFMKEDEMDEETEKKGKKEVRLSKVVQELRSPSETTAMTEGSRKTYEDRPEFYESHVRLTTKEAMNLRRKSMKPKRESTRSHSGTLRRQAALIPEQTSASTASSKPISTRSLSASAASRLAYLESLGANLRSFSCPCLPGYCTCEGPSHWTYRDSKSLNLSDEVEEEKYRRLEEISMGKVERTDSELKAKGIYVWKSNECPCLHEEDKDKLLPKSSEELVVVAASPAPKQVEEEHVCTCTKRFEKTLVILKPDALVFKDVVKRALIHIGGLEILNERIVRLSPEQVSEIYSERYLGSAYFPLFVVQLSRYPIMILSVAGMNAVRVVNAMIGSDRLIPEAWLFPESIKRKIGLLKNIEAELRVSENAEQAALETRYFFPQSLIEPIPTIPNKVSDYCGKYVNPTLSKGLATVAKARPVDPVLFLAEWLLTHNPYQPWYNPQSINIIPT